ncbi:MAG: transcriptional repressor LexA [Firmicutes bacterium]|nr:transcriptional repressor LexA [Bacillota bacterium]
MEGLTKREQQILNYMKQEIKTKGYPPTVREICAAVGIKSTSTAHKDIESLVRQGYLVKDPSKPRALLVKDPFGMETVQSASNLVEIPRNDVIDVPIVGRVAAGTPILAEQNIEDSFPIPSRYASTGTNYMLRVRGESMIEAGIMDGDLILVQQADTASNGEMVVAMIDGFESEATVKTFYRENGYIRLQPENSSMSPIIVQDVKILGKVKGVFRYFN